MVWNIFVSTTRTSFLLPNNERNEPEARGQQKRERSADSTRIDAYFFGTRKKPHHDDGNSNKQETKRQKGDPAAGQQAAGKAAGHHHPVSRGIIVQTKQLLLCVGANYKKKGGSQSR